VPHDHGEELGGIEGDLPDTADNNLWRGGYESSIQQNFQKFFHLSKLKPKRFGNLEVCAQRQTQKSWRTVPLWLGRQPGWRGEASRCTR